MGFTVQKISDEGTASPWIARCFLGIMEIRDFAFPRDSKEKTRFEFLHGKILENLTIANSARKSIFEMLDSHSEKFQKGLIYSKQGENYIINENIDTELKEKFYSFIANLHSAIEDVGKKIGGEFGFKCDIYGEDKSFEKWASIFLTVGGINAPAIIEMLREDRKWISKLKDIRRGITHHSWSLRGITYDFHSGIISVPNELLGLDNLWMNGWQFVEDMMVLTLEKRLPPPFCIIEIPESDRDPNNAIKYRVSCPDI